MAAPTRSVGRPRLFGSTKYIRLRESIFIQWRRKKEELGYLNSSDSEFVEFILHRGLEDLTTCSAMFEGLHVFIKCHNNCTESIPV